MATLHCNGVLFRNIQAVLFDKDGTLAASEAFLRNLAQRRSRLIDAQIPGVQEPLLMSFGVHADRLDPAGLMAVGSRVENEIAAAAYIAETGRGWIESLAIARSAFAEADHYLERRAVATPPIEGTLDLLQNLSKMGLKMGILSSDSTQNVQDFVQNYGLSSYFDVLVGIDGYASKSDPQLLQNLLAEFQVSPDQTVLVGDSQLDMQIADHLGLAGGIAMVGGWATPIQVAGARATVASLYEIQVKE